jgi:tetratricopeptide (TPR) repeat protein
VFYVNDSLLGPNITITYESFVTRWEQLSYSWSRYIPIYRPEQAPLVAEILGMDWTDMGMYTRALPALRAAVTARPTDSSTWGRYIEALIGAERYADALDAMDSAPPGRNNYSAMSTTRLRVMIKAGRQAAALAAIETALERVTSEGRSAASLWLLKAEALRGLGRLAEARAAFERAIQLDRTLTEAPSSAGTFR